MTDGDDIMPMDVSAIMLAQGLGSLRVDSLLLPIDAVSPRLTAGATGTNGHEGGRFDARCLITSSLPVGSNRDSASLWQGRVLIRSMTVLDGAIQGEAL